MPLSVFSVTHMAKIGEQRETIVQFTSLKDSRFWGFFVCLFCGCRLPSVLGEGSMHRNNNEPLDLFNLAIFASKLIGMFLYKNK